MVVCQLSPGPASPSENTGGKTRCDPAPSHHPDHAAGGKIVSQIRPIRPRIDFTTLPENPVKRPDLGAARKSVIRGHFAKISRICPLILIPKNGLYFISGICWPDQREIGHRMAIAAVS